MMISYHAKKQPQGRYHHTTARLGKLNWSRNRVSKQHSTV